MGLRLAALITVVAGLVLCWLLVAIQQYAWDDLTGGRLPYVPDAWFGVYQDVYQRLGDRWGMSAYYFWGRFAVLVYVALLVGALALPSGRTGPARVGRRLLLIAVVVGLIGDVLAYWGGTGDDLTTLTGIGFGLLETPALILMTPALILYGVGLRRERLVPQWAAWSLVAGGVLAPPGAFLVITYVPHGVLATVLAAVALALLGAASSSRSASQDYGQLSQGWH